MALSRLAGLDPQVRARAEWCVALAQAYDVPVTVTSGYRPTSQQRELYEQYRACVAKGTFGTDRCPTRWPANPPGESAHEYRWAWDSVVPDNVQAWWNAVRRYAGFYVPPNDVIHAEVPNWRQYR